MAEGIEEIEQLTQLRSVGCLSGQGFLFAKPLQAEAIGPLLERGGTRPRWERADPDDPIERSAVSSSTVVPRR